MKLRGLAALLALVFPGFAWAQAPSVPNAVYVMNADGTAVRKVAEVEGYTEHQSPRFSHDGTRLVFDAKHAAADQRACFVVNLDGTGLRELGKGQFPDWSPDDQQIAFQGHGAAGSGEIFVQNLDGKGRARIIAGHSPRFSPDGSRLAYSDRQMLRVVDLLSGEETAVLGEQTAGVFNGFAWSPDGKRLAVVTRAAVGGPRHLRLAGAHGAEIAGAPRATGGMGGFISFSPDGKQIVFADNYQMFVVDTDGDGKPRKLPGQVGMNRHPAFSPDGKSIAFVGSRKP